MQSPLVPAGAAFIQEPCRSGTGWVAGSAAGKLQRSAGGLKERCGWDCGRAARNVAGK